jgi:hypothetical protein
MSAWAIPVPLLPDESLLSWLARAAITQGCDPLTLTGAIWPGWRVWTLDPDRGVSLERLHALSEASGIPMVAFEAAALRADAERVVGHPLPDSKSWPWILALGSRNRTRKGGQQFCPECLASGTKPFFRRHWRFAWQTGCTTHERQLLDRCDPCGAPVEPHRLLAEDKHLAWCARCKSDLRNAASLPASKDALDFQRMADKAVVLGKGAFGNRLIPVSDWFATARFLAGLIRQACRRVTSKLADAIRSLGVHVNEHMLPATGLALELLTVAERQALLEATHHLFELGPEVLILSFKGAGISAASLHDKRRPFQNPLQEMIEFLPNGRRERRKPSVESVDRPKRKLAVLAAWARLQRKMLAETT